MKRNYLVRTLNEDHLLKSHGGSTSTKKHKTENAMPCTIYVGDDNAIRSPYAICANITGIAQTTHDKQVCAHVIGIMICFFEKSREPLLDLMKDRRFCVEIVSLPSQAEIKMFDLDNLPVYDHSVYLTLFGFCLLLLFKNCTQANYNNYARGRLNALRAFAGTPPDVTTPNPFSLKKAQAVRKILGAIPELKKLVIELIINNSDGGQSYHSILAHLGSTLEYNEMSAVRFSYETLVMSGSPILEDSRVSGEVSNLYEAIGLMNQSKHPKYFRYLAPKEQVSKIDRARFPTLTEVALRIKGELMGDKSVLQMVSTKGVRDDLVADLFAMHKSALGRLTPPAFFLRKINEMFAPIQPSDFFGRD